MVEFFWFGIKQAWACIFGALLLAAIILTGLWYPDISLARYDFLFCYAVLLQVALLVLKLESPREFGVVVVFHLMATAMELFKTSQSIGSWSYPEPCVIKLGNVPLFAGFMYSAVGSYMARIWRVFHFRFEHFPPFAAAAALALMSYVNFFTHHTFPDFRIPILVVLILIFWRTRVIFRPDQKDRKMSLLLGFGLVAVFIYLAENIGTLSKAWLYPNQKSGWELVSTGKFIAWFLLMQLSFVLVYGLRLLESKLKREGASRGKGETVK